MSFPWTHRIEQSIKTIPHDIDEVAGVREADSHNLDGSFGRFEYVGGHNGQHPGTVAAARRSREPGVIEYTTIHPPTVAQRLSFPPLHVDKTCYDDPNIPGELSLRKFEEVQARKRRQEDMESMNVKTTMVSIRFGSTSSRSSIFDDVQPDGRRPLFLEAMLPMAVQAGFRVRPSQISKHPFLGSYDCRGKLNGTGDNGSANAKTGRIRLMWTSRDPSKASSSGTSSNRTHKSILTGQYAEGGAQKRPRRVKVAIRVNGSLVSTDASADDGTVQSSVVDEALESAGSQEVEPTNIHQQCSLDTNRFIANTLEDRASEDSSREISKIREHYAITANSRRSLAIDLPVLHVTPPKIDCFALADGLITTACSKRGSMQITEKRASSPQPSPSSEVHAIGALMEVTAADRGMCSVCWATSGPGIHGHSSSLLTCAGCKLTVHQACYGGGWANGATSVFKCDVCLDFDLQPGNHDTEAYRSHRWKIKCSCCRERGGSLVRHDAGGWIHDVCRIWAPSEVPPPNPVCCICDKNKSPMLQCVASGCQVMFHPMCALVASNAADLKQLDSDNTDKKAKSELERVIEHDTFLCTQYKLAKIEVGSNTGRGLTTVPVAFCGYHNPDRRADFQGLYPGGRNLQGAMRVPTPGCIHESQS